MGNNLNENIEGRFVLLDESWFKKPEMAADARERVFLAQGGFGCWAETAGNAVMGEFVVDGERVRVEGYNLEGRFATMGEVLAALDERMRRKIDYDDRMVKALAAMKVGS